jgi:hypothetical protein
MGTDYHHEIVVHAMSVFGYLIKSVSLKKISFADFADKI